MTASTGRPALPGRILAGPTAWRGEELARTRDWIRTLGPAAVREIDSTARSLLSRGIPLERVERADFPLPALTVDLEEILAELLHGRGFVLLRGLPVVGRTPAQMATTFWGLGLHLGTAVPQDVHGHLLGHVRDEGRSAGDPEARIYQTNARQGWHTDSADVVALLCVRPAAAGGRSGLVSAVTLHDALLEKYPHLLPRLFDDFHTDHRGEHRPGASPTFTAPILSWDGGELSVLYQRAYIESAQRFDHVPPLTAEQVAALDALDALADDPRMHLALDMNPGDVLLLNNLALLHDRTAFVDAADPARQRHLLRLWLCPVAGRPPSGRFATRSGA